MGKSKINVCDATSSIQQHLSAVILLVQKPQKQSNCKRPRTTMSWTDSLHLTSLVMILTRSVDPSSTTPFLVGTHNMVCNNSNHEQ